MSWSVQFIGKPENVVAALDKYGESLTGHSKEEFDDAKPALQALVRGNVGQTVSLNASGHGSFASDGMKTSGTVTCTLASIYAGILV